VSVGLIALLDDIVAIAKVAAASLDDVASQAARAGVKAAGVVIDDAAVRRLSQTQHMHAANFKFSAPLVPTVARSLRRGCPAFWGPDFLLD